MGWGRYSDWRPYVPVDVRQKKAVAKARKKAEAQGRAPQPVIASGKKMAKTFWGMAWCDHLHAFRDYANRLPRGATYLRNGSVVDLVIQAGKVEAIVAGSEPYTVSIEIQTLQKKRWKELRQKCSASIDSLLDLLAGRLSDGIMRELTSTQTGLFPTPREIRMSCSCPDYSSCCKHLAAVMYGVGVRLDTQPELLFLLRGVDHSELVSEAVSAGNLDRELGEDDQGALANADLGELFGIDLAPPADLAAEGSHVQVERSPKRMSGARAAGGAVAAKKSSVSEPAKRRGARAKLSGPTAGEAPSAAAPLAPAALVPANTRSSKTSRVKSLSGNRSVKKFSAQEVEPRIKATESKRKSGADKTKAAQTTRTVKSITAPAVRTRSDELAGAAKNKAGRKTLRGKVSATKARKTLMQPRAVGGTPPVAQAAAHESPPAPAVKLGKPRRPGKPRQKRLDLKNSRPRR